MLARFFLLIATVCLLTAPLYAEMEDSNWGRVYVEILPTVAVYYNGGDINMGSVQARDQVCATLTFAVHANGQDIRMRCGASKLFKDDVPTSSWFLPVDIETQASIHAAYGEQHAGLPVLVTPGDAGTYGSVMLNHTDWFDFGSGDGGSWSYDVEVHICWHGDNAELFQGDYSGAVVLWAMYVDI